jgi:hypothetical protein
MVERAAAAVECWQAEGILNAMDRFNQPTPNPADSNPQENSK